MKDDYALLQVVCPTVGVLKQVLATHKRWQTSTVLIEPREHLFWTGDKELKKYRMGMLSLHTLLTFFRTLPFRSNQPFSCVSVF